MVKPSSLPIKLISENMNNKIRSNIFLFLLFFLPISAVAIFIGIFSVESFKNKVSPFFILIILALVLYVFQSIIYKYAKGKDLIGGKLYSEWMRRAQPNWLVYVVFIIIVIVFAIIRRIFW